MALQKWGRLAALATLLIGGREVAMIFADVRLRGTGQWGAIQSVAPLLGLELTPIGMGDVAPGSPWQNGFAERLIGSIRRECVDHVVVLGEAHLRRILTKYAAYYNELRTHRSLGKDAPIHRATQHVGRIAAVPVLGGIHHHYCRI
jgi:hypothetical protein